MLSAAIGFLGPAAPAMEKHAVALQFRDFVERLRADSALSFRVISNVHKLCAFAKELTGSPSLADEVGAAFRRLVSHTRAQLSAAWADLPNDDALGDCVEKLLAVKSFDGLQPAFSKPDEDRAFNRRCAVFKNILRPEHLGLPRSITDSASYGSAWSAISGELSRIETYRAPSDKLVCIVNAARLLMGLLGTATARERAEAAASEASKNSGATASQGSVDTASTASCEGRAAGTPVVVGLADSSSAVCATTATAAQLPTIVSGDDLLPAISLAIARVGPAGLPAGLRCIRLLRGDDGTKGEAACFLTHFLGAHMFLISCTPDDLQDVDSSLRAAWPAALSADDVHDPDADEAAGDGSQASNASSSAATECLVPSSSEFETWFAKKAALADVDPASLTVDDIAELLREFRNVLTTARKLRELVVDR